MDEQTTTPDAVADTGADNAQPAEQQDTGAASQPTEQPTATSNDEPSTDDTSSWLEAKGIDPNSPDALSKLADMARNAERKMHESTAKASELQKVLTQPAQADPDQSTLEALAAEQAKLRTHLAVQDFFASHSEAKQYEAQMATAVVERPELGELVNAGYLSISDLYNLVRGADPKFVANAKTAGGREALQELAAKQQGKAIPGTATKTEFGSDKGVDPFLAGLLAKR